MRRSILFLLCIAASAALAGCGGDGSGSTVAQPPPDNPAPPPPEPPATPPPASTPPPPPPAAPRPQRIVIVVEGGKPRGGIARPKIAKGRSVVLVVRSDTADEVHLHGYDISRDVAAGGTARITFVAKIPGRFEVELHDLGVQLAEVSVR